MAEFKSFASILRASGPESPISPLIAEVERHEPELWREERLFPALLEERLDRAVQVLLREIAAEVVARELLLGPADVAQIVRRLRERYCIDDATHARIDGNDVAFAMDGGEIDASLGVRVASAIERASP